MRLRLPVSLIVLILAGCGGGTGGSAPGTSAALPLGTAVLPGATLVVTRTSEKSGSDASVRVTCADPGIAAIEVLVGSDWENATAAVVAPAGAGMWNASLAVPAPPAGAGVLVRVTFSDGNVAESGRDAFRL